MYFHTVLVLPGARQRYMCNLSEEEAHAQVILPFLNDGIVKYRRAGKTTPHQVVDLRIYKTKEQWNHRQARFEEFVAKKNNVAKAVLARAAKRAPKVQHRVFVVMPIQGERYGTMNEQRIHDEFNRRFVALENTLGKHQCVAIRIDKEVPLDDLVRRIKTEIARAQFVVADLTDERPSCYFEAGYAEALGKPIVYFASKESVVTPGQKTRIHFDVHMNVNLFSNHKELQEKLDLAIGKNRGLLFAPREGNAAATATAKA
ncbi:MAG: hypothetical protein KF871_00425 [Hydrogenophaga sp.]|uniref:hypothetical protein n=1 Tax=Hydrogenophaga sp. TaxID=1904254 RepID=UPI001E0E4855|nr:hypothetical protein [Hydrogenophaga sp.]MBX3608330.1 hypothetical protein [Hydrogenophaga sp.]